MGEIYFNLEYILLVILILKIKILTHNYENTAARPGQPFAKVNSHILFPRPAPEKRKGKY